MKPIVSLLLTAAALMPHPHHHRRHHHHAQPMTKVLASEYGGDQPLACGGRWHPWTRGVANTSLPCGTRVRLCIPYARCIIARVIDRGPYCCGRTYDLTDASARDAGTRYPWSGRALVSVLR